MTIISVGNVETYFSALQKERSMRKKKCCKVCNILFLQEKKCKRRICSPCRVVKRKQERLKITQEHLSKLENPNAKQRAKMQGHGKGCNSCDTIKTDADFNKKKSFCKSCESLYNKKMAKKHWAKTKERRKEQRRKMRFSAININSVQLRLR